MVAVQAEMAELLGGDIIHHACGINPFGPSQKPDHGHESQQKHGDVAKRTAQWRFEQIEKRAGVRHLGIHAMRHTTATNLHHFKIPLK